MPRQREVIDRFGGSCELPKDHPQVLLCIGKINGDRAPFYISSFVNDLILYNCMLNSRASTNVMTLEIMYELGLKISNPCRNVHAMDSREVQDCGDIKDLEFCLQQCTERILIMDVIVIDCITEWGMLLSKRWVVDANDSIQMDLSYAKI